ncbi:MAG: Chromatin structure-remodeling complex protein rsc9 [Bogoriella megaspora]|nr:MAG: Chromatin structure-remodeling complex protein rsc9 [Bogoriella megaspora]
MAPARPARGPDIDRTEEYEDFMKRLTEYHEKRGTTLDPEPKVGPNRHLDLYRLYQKIIEEGGYDVVSDTKNNKLAWRKIAQDFLPGMQNLPTLVFTVKTAYYKNLAESAFEISDHWKEEPPPKEILEDLTAKGGDLRNRTLDNYTRTPKQENEMNGHDADGSGEEKTPKQLDGADNDEPGSTGRATRSLRQAPPQRVLFQPELASSRQTRNSSNQMNSPGPSLNSYGAPGHGQTNGASMTLANYEPRPQLPVTLKPVATPASNPEHFTQKRKAREELSRGPVTKHKGMMLPGTGYTGPNIYLRALLALQSHIPEEESYALHHLVKISHERGDKYRFDQFPGLADALTAKVLEITSLFYDVEWEICYRGGTTRDESSTLDGLQGTPDVLQKLGSKILINGDDDVQTESFLSSLGRINEAGLVLRNMVMLEENAAHLAKLSAIRDFITIALNLPKRAAAVELQHYALEIAEQVTKYFIVSPSDPLFLSLLAQLDTTDRGAIITSLRAIGRISIKLDQQYRLRDVPITVVQRVCEWLMIDDEELRNACLDFLYQFTVLIDNVEALIQSVNVEGLVNQLVRLLMWNATSEERREKPRHHSISKPQPQSDTVPKLSHDLVEQLLKYEEPDRSSHWLRACFEDDPVGEMTQIALWQAYQGCFGPLVTSTNPLLIAGDFIKNVSSTFIGASAQVADASSSTPKYIIKGIKPRMLPIDPKGRTYSRCKWQNHVQIPPTAGGKPLVVTRQCEEFARDPEMMWRHIMNDHLKIPRNPADPKKYNLSPQEGRKYNCHWGPCNHFLNGSKSPFEVGMHVKVHLTDISKQAAQRSKPTTRFTTNEPETPTHKRDTVPKTWLNTQTDERNEAAGLPLTACLVLRNLARLLPKVEVPLPGTKNDKPEEGEWVRLVFAPVQEQLYFVAAFNWSLREYVASLMKAISASGS